VLRIPWNDRVPPSILEVKWEKEGRRRSAIWIVNLEDHKSFKLPPELRELDLESLLEILSISRPVYLALQNHQKRLERKKKQEGSLKELDPHVRVREKVQTFLLQRTRRFARALENLQLRLEKPCASRQSLEWRMRGPVSPGALARAVGETVSDSGSPSEKAFLLSEIALMLGRVNYQHEAGSLPRRIIDEAVTVCIKEIRQQAHPHILQSSEDVANYARRAFEEAMK